MYGDTAVIRKLAGGMDERAVDLRATADQLIASADSTTWWSVGGDRMRLQVKDRATNLRDIAADYEDAADRLREHADKVDELKAVIELIERKVVDLVEGAVQRLKDLGVAIVDGVKDGIKAIGNLVGIGGDEPDPRDVELAQYVQPPTGDKAWLNVPDELGVEV